MERFVIVQAINTIKHSLDRWICLQFTANTFTLMGKFLKGNFACNLRRSLNFLMPHPKNGFGKGWGYFMYIKIIMQIYKYLLDIPFGCSTLKNFAYQNFIEAWQVFNPA
tara:strand:+ start:204 stop:530 length:327 start_codon:yes stop_codon:yes gene_type:complete